MVDDVFWQDGDQLSEANLGKALLADNNTDYVNRGAAVNTPSNGEVVAEAGEAFIEDTSTEQLYKVYPSEATLTLPAPSGNNYVYITFDPDTQDSATWEITDTQGSGLTNPVTLLRAVVDGGAGAVDTRHDNPTGDFESVNAESASVTNETLVELRRSASTTGLSEGTWHTISWDSEVTDVRGEYDMVNYQFVPNESGVHSFAGGVTVSPGASGDIIVVRLRNVTDSTTRARPSRVVAASSGKEAVPISFKTSITAGKTYELQIQNFISTFGITGQGDGRTMVTISKELIE